MADVKSAACLSVCLSGMHLLRNCWTDLAWLILFSHVAFWHVEQRRTDERDTVRWLWYVLCDHELEHCHWQQYRDTCSAHDASTSCCRSCANLLRRKIFFPQKLIFCADFMIPRFFFDNSYFCLCVVSVIYKTFMTLAVNNHESIAY